MKALQNIVDKVSHDVRMTLCKPVEQHDAQNVNRENTTLLTILEKYPHRKPRGATQTGSLNTTKRPTQQ